jgi:peroxiredoxin family protein
MSEISTLPPDATAHLTPLEMLEQRLTALEKRHVEELAEIRERLPEDKASIIVFSGDLDRTLGAFIIATGAAAMGLDVTMFFTFWGLSAIKEHRSFEGKNLAEKMMALMTPASSLEMTPSKLAFFGAGSVLLRQMMKDKNVSSLEEMMAVARELGVHIVACEMSMDVMGIHADELMSDVQIGGVATFLAEASRSKVSLFI